MTEMEWTHVTMGTPYAQGYSPNLVSPLSERRFYLQPATEEEERSSGKGLTEECPQLCLGECLQTQPSPSLKPPEEGSNKDGLHCVLLSPTLQAHLGANQVKLTWSISSASSQLVETELDGNFQEMAIVPTLPSSRATAQPCGHIIGLRRQNPM